MGKFNGLLINEATKQYKKVSIKVMLVLILVMAIGLPVAVKMISEKGQEDWYIRSYNHQINFIDMSISEISKDKTATAKLEVKRLEAEKTKFQMLLDKKISYEDWRSDLAEKWFGKKMEAIVLESLLEGISKEDIEKGIRDVDRQKEVNYFSLSKEEAKVELDKVIKEQTAIVETIDKNDYFKHLEEVVASNKANIELKKKDIKAIEEKIAKENNKDLEQVLEKEKNTLGMQEEILKVTQYKLDNKIPNNKKDWKNLTLKDLEKNIYAKYQSVLSEEDFNKQFIYQIGNGLTYEKYKSNFESSKVKNLESIELDWYSLKNNLPQIQFENDARSTVKSIYLLFVTIAAIIAIIMAGGIVSTEHSKGTIRLLLIRPVSRWKILLSKLITVFVTGYGLLFASVVLIIISSGAMYGFDSYSLNVLTVKAGNVIEQNYFISLMPELLFTSISLIFAIAAAFFLSTVTRNTAVAVGLTSVAFLGNMIATLIMAQLKMKWVVNTLIPYLNLSLFKIGEGIINMLEEAYGMTFNVNMGALQLALFSVLGITISFVVFMKKDVRN